MQEVRDLIEKVVRSQATSVLITGRERDRQGTGRAGDPLPQRPRAGRRSWRSTAPRSRRPCSRTSSSGTSGAPSPTPADLKKGLVELCDGGTLFLDEVADMSLPTQAKLLRFIDYRNFKRVGGTEDISVDIRIVAASNKDLESEVRTGPLPQRPLLPPEGREHPPAPAARARRRRPAAGAALPARVLPPVPEGLPRHHARRRAPAAVLPLAGQRARAART